VSLRLLVSGHLGHNHLGEALVILVKHHFPQANSLLGYSLLPLDSGCGRCLDNVDLSRQCLSSDRLLGYGYLGGSPPAGLRTSLGMSKLTDSSLVHTVDKPQHVGLQPMQ
jgi:hypothetical protein